MKFPRLPPDEIVEILDMVVAGGNHMAIAEAHKITLPHLYHIMKDQGIKIGRGHQSSVLDRFSEDSIDSMLALYEAGEPVTQICARWDISMQVFYSILASLGVPTRVQRKETMVGDKLRLDKAVSMYVEGWAYWRIEVETGIKQPRLMRELHKRGVPFRLPYDNRRKRL